MNNIIIKKKYDLKERTEKFGQAVVQLAKKIPENNITKSFISQVVRAGTSIGANYCEADNAESKRDFIHKISLCKKESCEAKYWLCIIAQALPHIQKETKELEGEAKELTLIFNAILQKSNVRH